MAPAKKRKLAEETYTCGICGVDRIASRFPDVNPTESCTHLINTCTGCLRDYIDARLDDVRLLGGIGCPECPAIMKQSDLEQVARKKAVLRFIELDQRRIADATPGWQWCLNPSCKSGQVHGELAKSDAVPSRQTRKSKKDEPAVQPFICKACKMQYCVPCTAVWHKGQTCEQYQDKVDRRHAQDIAASSELVDRIAKDCPNPTCKVKTEKDGGCPHIWCTRCMRDWCWNCNTLFTQGACECQRQAIRDHAAANRPAPGLVPANQQFGLAATAMNLDIINDIQRRVTAARGL
ncbi:hypothetical protein AMS68_000261 [Peltaster fructicola]|uniref:RBR-type E3 ubiquitin transferase n=1 Tax=Peltaster fructicola TaxID=286661 RepID=A0A6H0XJ50_9PEZI|nr:hypothetical protein AMS68_000261 [Peltaster fructicola]